MLDDINLDDTVREVIDNGGFPLRRPDRQWGGPGGGTQCSICGAHIGADALELELEFDASGAVTTHHVHVACYGAWERFLQASAPSESTRLPEKRRAGHSEERGRLSAADDRGTISSRDDSSPSGPARR